MKELIRTNNVVEISYIHHILSENGIEAIELDQHTSFAEGSIGAIQRRIMVHDEDFDRAQMLIQDV